MNTVEKLERINRIINKLRRIVIVLILLAAAWITYDVYRKRNAPLPPQVVPTTNEAAGEN